LERNKSLEAESKKKAQQATTASLLKSAVHQEPATVSDRIPQAQVDEFVHRQFVFLESRDKKIQSESSRLESTDMPLVALSIKRYGQLVKKGKFKANARQERETKEASAVAERNELEKAAAKLKKSKLRAARQQREDRLREAQSAVRERAYREQLMSTQAVAAHVLQARRDSLDDLLESSDDQKEDIVSDDLSDLLASSDEDVYTKSTAANGDEPVLISAESGDDIDDLLANSASTAANVLVESGDDSDEISSGNDIDGLLTGFDSRR
jgi:hypothetical protein